MESGKISRRIILKTAAVAIAAPYVITQSRAASKQLVFVGFGGSYQDGQTKAYIQPFEKETGIKVIQTTGVDLAKLRVQVQSKNVEWDIVSFPDRLLYTAINEGLFAPLDYKVIDKSDIMPDVVTPYSVGHVSFAMQMTYSKSFYKSGGQPKNWKDFWNTAAIPGKRGLYNAPTFILEFALLADGVSRDKLYPLNVDRAFRSLDKIKDKVVWWDQFPQAGVMLQSGSMDVTGWTRGASVAYFDKQPVGLSFDDFIYLFESWTVPKGAPNYDAAMRFIDFAIKPERQAALTKFVTQGPTNVKAWALVDPQVKELLPTDPANINRGARLDTSWWSKNLDHTTEQWNEWRLT